MNSDVPHNSDLVSELHRNCLFKFKFCLQFDETGTCRHMMAPLCERITNLFSSTPAANHDGKIVQLQSALNDNFNDVSRKVKHVTHFRANNYSPIIIFPQNLCHFVHIGAVSLIHSALERNAAILRKVLAPFSLSHVTDSCFRFLSFLIFFFLPLFYNNYSG